MKTLRIYYDNHVDLLVELVWDANATRIVFSAPSLRSEIEILLEQGLYEWVGPVTDPSPIHTVSSSTNFLDRLVNYFRQYNFSATLTDSHATN